MPARDDRNGGGEAALSGGLERLSGDGAAVRVGRIGPGRLCAGLQAMQELDGALGVGCGGEDRPLVALQNLNPVRDIARVVRTRLQRQAKIGSQECGSQFGTQFFACVSLIAPALAPEAPVQARGMTSPMHFMP